MKPLFFSALDWPQILSFCIIAVCVLLIVGFILAAVLKNKDENYLIRKLPSTLSVTLDLKNNKASIFSKKRILGVSYYSIDEYLKFFQGSSKELVQNLIGKIKTNVVDNIPKTLEVNCLHNSTNKKVYFSVIYINSINVESEIVHLTQYFYDSIPCLVGIDLKRENKIRATYNVPLNVVKTRLVTSGTKGASIMFHNKISVSFKNQDISTFVYYALINILSKHLDHNRILYKNKNGDLIFTDFKVSKKHKIFKLVNTIKKEFDRFIEMNGIYNRIKLSMGIAEHKYYPKDYQKIMKSLNQATVEAVNKNRDFVFYENQVREEFYFDQSYRTEVQSIVLNHSVKYNFQPIVQVSNCDIVGFFSKITPISTIFNKINEVKDYAYKLNYNKELFSELSNHLLSKFVNEAGSLKDNTYLFYSLKFHELQYANSLLGYVLASKKANLVLVFNETDVLKSLDRNQDYLAPFRKLISKGYRLSLDVTLKTLELPDEFYSLFDYFQFDVKFFDENFDDVAHSSLTIKRSIEKVLKYRKKVIVSSVNSWNDVELRIQENLKYLAGDVISPFNEMIVPINKKVFDKIKKIKKRG